MSVNLCQCAMRSVIVQPIFFSVGERLGGGGGLPTLILIPFAHKPVKEMQIQNECRILVNYTN